ncbi:MAG TPA: AAA domain-containing protein [Tepidisphaeraceae bacterium]|nr:AAA domain-containing protein [Tepidisphaeraceae bacterium]
MPQEKNKILVKMLERLFAALANGPSLNCKPHSSRQRIDLMQFTKLRDRTPDQVLADLLGEQHQARVSAKAPLVRKPEASTIRAASDGQADELLTPEEKAARAAWTDQQALIGKLRTIAEDARTYENDTGVHVLHIGYPLLSLPPGSFGLQRNFSRRILAPIAFISVTLGLRGGGAPGVVLECKNHGQDLVVPNTALLAWLEQQTREEPVELPPDESGEHPWQEIAAIVRRVCDLAQTPVPEAFATEQVVPPLLKPAPRSEEDQAEPTILPSAILGLFPVANQGLLRDMQALAAGEPIAAPLDSFLSVETGLALTTPDVTPEAEQAAPRQARVFADERLIALADPCQARAVRLARTCRGLVIHGPPGTGKSQTIANIIGDHLSRGQRVLMVCDKRTALDVVVYRLEALGLGQLCAVVHDPQRDQRELYKAIREQLDGLADAKAHPRADGELKKVDAELQALHQELSDYHAALMESGAAGSVSFHELMGRWLELPSSDLELKESLVQNVTADDLEQHARQIGEILERATSAQYSDNPWTNAAGISLREFLAKPMDQFRQTVRACADVALAADATIDPAIPPFDLGIDLQTQGQKRAQLAPMLKDLIAQADPTILVRWAEADAKNVRQTRQKLTDVTNLIELLKSGPLDTELALAARPQPPTLIAIGQQLDSLEQYLRIAAKWFAFLCMGAKSSARRTLSQYGLPLDVASALRLKKFLSALRARIILRSLNQELLHQQSAGAEVSDEALAASLDQHRLLFDVLLQVADEPALVSLKALIARALAEPATAPAFIDGLAKSPKRAAAIAQLEKALADAGLFRPAWQKSLGGEARQGRAAADILQQLFDRLGSLEQLLRVREGLSALPPELGAAVKLLVGQRAEMEPGLVVLKKAVLSAEIARRLASDPRLQAADAQRLKSSFERYRLLDAHKKTLVRDATLNHWITRQREKLLATTGSRLNSHGADLRRRLTIRGQRAMRLRQVVAAGQEIEGGDPLFDLRPVWMASPETVAQVFARKPLFDVAIFDEASQCRLEEALPVLTRAQRVVIAGDPRQLPPTRFFESAIVSDDDEDAQTQQEWFETQQGEIEDLLGAALNIEIQECYLDVHYRSRNADLIEFSNRQFYNSRLQPIPAHPSNRSRFAPLTLYKCNGVYDKNCNVAEAQQVGRIVNDLLKRADPPSIGIACFNIQQRDLIVETLDDMAAEDGDFARRLADARTRRGKGSFDGLFVKNLESVQGDERDHMIISTTYGPDPKGKFYRRFGPLGRAGGGRRLNVLVTRAREEVHLVTSIPQSIYSALPPIPPGQSPGGAWLLFSYLSYAQNLAEEYERSHQLLSQLAPDRQATVNVHRSRSPSLFSQAFGRQLAQGNNVGSEVQWGNDGFCIDLALHHPRRVDDVTLGVICDLTRFAQAEDPVEWEAFRTAVHESQGWKLHRLWTPHFFRDPQGCTDSILRDTAELLATEQKKDAIRVVDAGKR